MSIFASPTAETFFEAIENKKHNRNKKELLHAYVIARQASLATEGQAIYSLSLFCFANGETLIEAIENRKHKRNKKVTKKGDLKRMAPPFLGAGHRL